MWNIEKGDMYSMSSFLMNHRPQYDAETLGKETVLHGKKLTGAVSKAVKQSLKCAILTDRLSRVLMGVSVSQ